MSVAMGEKNELDLDGVGADLSRAGAASPSGALRVWFRNAKALAECKRMRPSVLLIVLGLAAVASSQTIAQPAASQSAPADAPKPPAAIVRGRVIAADSGQPLRHAHDYSAITLQRIDPGSHYDRWRTQAVSFSRVESESKHSI
jgi:hypothetical protein